MEQNRINWTGRLLRTIFFSVAAFLFCELVLPPDCLVEGWQPLLGLCVAVFTVLMFGGLVRQL